MNYKYKGMSSRCWKREFIHFMKACKNSLWSMLKHENRREEYRIAVPGQGHEQEL